MKHPAEGRSQFWMLCMRQGGAYWERLRYILPFTLIQLVLRLVRRAFHLFIAEAQAVIVRCKPKPFVKVREEGHE
ncbi:hypothetical protein [Bacillus vallismortis]|uniref:hypothetical protein n=1 Tax=Bacillus vallismortis TaxID=72361 RepID=UPI002091B6D2|nr:hypothetical protein [Bacillus vallismortis]MCO4852075.1 hypothetical protein [Bacillus vallismortis]